MKFDLDELSAEITRDLSLSPLEKTLPPRLRYRYYKWLKQFRHLPEFKQNGQKLVSKCVDQAFKHMKAIKELRKNEFMCSAYENGSIRMDFGAEIDPKIKKAAMSWAKKKGLKTVEASLDKSDGTASYVVLGSAPNGVCSAYFVQEI